VVIVYRGKWRWMPVHAVCWSNGNCRTATCVVTIIYSRTDKNYTACFCSKLTPIHTEWYTRLSTTHRKRPFGYPMINYFLMLSSKFIVLIDTNFFLRISAYTRRIKLFLSSPFQQTDCQIKLFLPKLTLHCILYHIWYSTHISMYFLREWFYLSTARV
jgi:hypothetical protein